MKMKRKIRIMLQEMKKDLTKRLLKSLFGNNLQVVRLANFDYEVEEIVLEIY